MIRLARSPSGLIHQGEFARQIGFSQEGSVHCESLPRGIAFDSSPLLLIDRNDFIIPSGDTREIGLLEFDGRLPGSFRQVFLLRFWFVGHGVCRFTPSGANDGEKLASIGNYSVRGIRRRS
jgi:hypothetical protein